MNVNLSAVWCHMKPTNMEKSLAELWLILMNRLAREDEGKPSWHNLKQAEAKRNRLCQHVVPTKSHMSQLSENFRHQTLTLRVVKI